MPFSVLIQINAAYRTLATLTTTSPQCPCKGTLFRGSHMPGPGSPWGATDFGRCARSPLRDRLCGALDIRTISRQSESGSDATMSLKHLWVPIMFVILAVSVRFGNFHRPFQLLGLDVHIHDRYRIIPFRIITFWALIGLAAAWILTRSFRIGQSQRLNLLSGRQKRK